MAVAEASPVQVWGPVSATFPSAVTLPLKPSNGAANESAQSVSVTVKLMPTREASQCAVTFQAPLRFGQPALPVLPPFAVAEPSVELELQALSSKAPANRPRIIPRWYLLRPRAQPK